MNLIKEDKAIFISVGDEETTVYILEIGNCNSTYRRHEVFMDYQSAEDRFKALSKGEDSSDDYPIRIVKRRESTMLVFKDIIEEETYKALEKVLRLGSSCSSCKNVRRYKDKDGKQQYSCVFIDTKADENYICSKWELKQDKLFKLENDEAQTQEEHIDKSNNHYTFGCYNNSNKLEAPFMLISLDKESFGKTIGVYETLEEAKDKIKSLSESAYIKDNNIVSLEVYDKRYNPIYTMNFYD